MGKKIISLYLNRRSRKYHKRIDFKYIFDKFFDKIMAIKITPKTAIAFIKVIVALSFAWPLSKNASKFQIIRFKILRTLFCINAVVLSISTVYTLYRNDYNLARITKLWCLLGAFIQIPLEITQCALQYDRLQVRNLYVFKAISTRNIYTDRLSINLFSISYSIL